MATNNNDDLNLEQMVTLAAAFKEVVEGRIQNDAVLGARLQNAFKPGEIEDLQELMGEILAESMDAVFSGTMSESFMTLQIKFLDTFTELAQRVISNEDLFSDLPAELKAQYVVDTFREKGAERFASLCEFKPGS